METKIKLIQIISDSYVTRTGFTKTTHEFKDCGCYDCIDSVILHLFSCSDGRFRVLYHRGKRLHTYNVAKTANSVIFS